MTAAAGNPGAPVGPALAGQTVAVLGATAGIGLATARRVRAEGADVRLVARRPEPLAEVVRDLGAVGSAAFDVSDTDSLRQFFQDLPEPVDHVLVTAGSPTYMPFDEMDLDAARREVSERIAMTIGVALHARDHVRPGGTLIFVGGTGGRRPDLGLSVVAAITAALPALTANLALEVAPVRVNLIAPGFVDTPLSASLLGEGLEERREKLRATLPIRRVVGPDDVALLAVHIMANGALTGATYDVDGGQQLLPK